MARTPADECYYILLYYKVDIYYLPSPIELFYERHENRQAAIESVAERILNIVAPSSVYKAIDSDGNIITPASFQDIIAATRQIRDLNLNIRYIDFEPSAITQTCLAEGLWEEFVPLALDAFGTLLREGLEEEYQRACDWDAEEKPDADDDGLQLCLIYRSLREDIRMRDAGFRSAFETFCRKAMSHFTV
jgi:hypothetical protein